MAGSNETSWEPRYQHLLLQASGALAYSLDYQTTMVSVANLAVSDFADWCSVDILTEEGKLDKVVVAHADKDKVDWARTFADKYPPDLSSNSGQANVFRTGKPLFIPEVGEEALKAAARDEEHYAGMKKIGIGSVIIAPLIARGQTLGTIAFIHSAPGHFKPPDLELAEELARRAAVALDNARLFTAVSRELDERRKAESALRESEERFRELADAMPVIVWVLDPDGSITSNRFYKEYTGLGDEGHGAGGWASVVHPEDRPGAFESYAKSIEDEVPWEHELRLRRHDGEYLWHLSRAVPSKAAHLKGVRWYGTSTDIHEQKLFTQELEMAIKSRTKDLEEALREAEAFNYAISHDLRSPLRAIVATARILQQEIGNRINEDHQKMLDRQAANALRLAALIDELLVLSRYARAEVKRQPLDISRKAIEISEELTLAGAVRSNCEIEVQPGMKATGDSTLVRVVLRNLLENACKFSPNGGIISVCQKEGVISVEDHGIGFDMQYLPKLFLPFERLVPDTQVPGTGIGLANVERIIRRHGGRVWAESDPGRGSTFFFTLEP